MGENINAPPERELVFREYIEILHKRKLVFILAFSVVFCIGVILELVKPLSYTSVSRVMVGPAVVQVRTIGGGMVMQQYEAQRELEVMKSDVVFKRAAAIIRAQKDGADKITASHVRGALRFELNKDKHGFSTNTITVASVSANPQTAFYIVKAVIKAYVDESKEYNRKIVKEAYDTATVQLFERRRDLEETERALTKYVLEHDIIARGIEVGDETAREKIAGFQASKSDEPKINEKYLFLKSQRINKEAFLDEIKKHRAKDEVTTLSIIAKKEEKLVDLTLRDALYEREKELSKLLLTQSDLHPDVIERRGEVGEAKKRITLELDKAARSLERDVEVLKSEEDKLYKLITEGLSDTMVEYTALKRDLEVKKEIYNNFVKQLQEVNLSEKLQKVHPINILSYPNIPRTPVNPKGQKIHLVLFLSLLISLGSVFLVESLDASIKNVEDLENLIGAPVLAVIPSWGKNMKREDLAVISIKEPKSIASESFRTLRTNIKFISSEKSIKSLIITSVAPGEGKSTIACNLSAMMASAGEKVVLLDGDLRRPTIHKYFNLDNTKGLSTYLIGGEKAEERIPVSKTELNTLDVITSGPIPPNPSELLVKKRMNDLIEKLKKEYDMIIIDSSPLLPVTDGLILASKADGVVLTFLANRTVKYSAMRVKSTLKNAGINIFGSILNRVEFKSGKYYGGYYYYHYGEYYGDKDTK